MDLLHCNRITGRRSQGEVNHERGNLKAPVGSCVVHLLVETRDAAHVQEMYEALRAQGYPIMER